MLTDGDATTEVALPQAWRTFEHLKAQLTGPSYARQGAPTELLDGASQAPSATLVLYSFFSRHSAKRRRGDAVASAREEIPAANEYTRRRTQRRATEGAVSAGCTPALRRAVHKALEIARTSMGSVETDVNSGAVLVLHVQFKPMKAARSAVKRRNKRPSPAWYISGLCVSECIPRVYRAATSATPLYPSAAEVPHEQGSGAAAASSRTNAGCEQATHIGDVWCSGTTFCGIKLFWVSAESRGCGLAYALIEAARRSVCYGYEVPAAHVAFSEPTWLGSRFAARYHQRDDFLVY
ncbi:hypothetical protein ABB37_08663 [Leptomonas pyrrhocoris]|uniref:N-acetyltransferase ESCO acetyl-transferase domain-containing protein n=1 Tax=Leptomonas pyrrhocoris TaxID=157538 RepID=A0A0M9FT80_LEPPY|nr:hypothetical protein ABB37_08663 [Leptomonas pyrrhocoris]KPA75386.1 hypothetical protein ABB37_08663 [Leptomonas pyrrhocoris]|eukprot:XP_015653825.1 hypothetical protein ABB37_08663 [Leptomonas pyrrhocoris]